MIANVPNFLTRANLLRLVLLGATLFPPTGAFAGFTSSNSAPTKCAKSDYACAQCEDPLQEKVSSLIASFMENPGPANKRWSERPPSEDLKIKPGATADDFLAKLLETMRSENTAGKGRLNFIPMGQSQSANDISPGFPRVLVKSPNSELWVAFTTDPKSPNYKSVEMMRWDGQAGKFQFQVLTFGQNAHADLTGKTCVRCHKAEARPIWDTYRAWPGSLSGRDGQLESCNNSAYLLAGASCDSPNGGPDTGARAYLGFMRRLAEAREGGSAAQAADAVRLRLLDIPTRDPVTPPQSQNAEQARAEIAAMEQQIHDSGYFHVPSFPAARENLNVDQKTASDAGPDHLAFDQLQALQACHVSANLNGKESWRNLKYAAAGALYCLGSTNVEPAEIQKYLPDDVKDRINKYFQKPENRRGPTGNVLDINADDGAALSMLFENTKNYHSHEAEEKTKICHDQLNGYLSRVEGITSPSEIERITQKECVEKKAMVIGGINAISDPGGVQGVAESAPGTSAYLRYLLEPAGIQVGAWSTSRGNGVGDGQSFSFSDQFLPMFQPQSSFQLAYDEAACKSEGHGWIWENGGKSGHCDGNVDQATRSKICDTLKELSKASLSQMPASAWTGLQGARAHGGYQESGGSNATPISRSAQ